MTTQLMQGISDKLWTFGPLQTTRPQDIITLAGDVVNGAGESRYSALRVPEAAAGYQVTAGKTLYIIKLFHSSPAAGLTWLLISGTADAGNSQIAAPAGVKSETSRTDGTPHAFISATANLTNEVTTMIPIAAGRFPGIRNTNASTTLRVLVLAIEL